MVLSLGITEDVGRALFRRGWIDSWFRIIGLEIVGLHLLKYWAGKDQIIDLSNSHPFGSLCPRALLLNFSSCGFMILICTSWWRDGALRGNLLLVLPCSLFSRGFSLLSISLKDGIDLHLGIFSLSKSRFRHNWKASLSKVRKKV